MNGQVLFVVWRESIEALLVVGILQAWLARTPENRAGLPWLWGGVGLGLVCAGLLGAAMLGIGSFLQGDAQELFQVAMLLTASALIVHMVVWMRRHGRSLKRDIEGELAQRSQTGQWLGVMLLAALAIAREGAETVVFLYGLGVSQSANDLGGFILSTLLGLGLAGVSFYLLQWGGKIFSWRRFFQVTEILLLLLGAGLLTTAIDKLIGLDYIPTLIDPIWSSAALLDDATPWGGFIAAFTGYRAQPALITVLVWLVYAAATRYWLRTPRTHLGHVRG